MAMTTAERCRPPMSRGRLAVYRSLAWSWWHGLGGLGIRPTAGKGSHKDLVFIPQSGNTWTKSENPVSCYVKDSALFN